MCLFMHVHVLTLRNISPILYTKDHIVEKISKKTEPDYLPIKGVGCLFFGPRLLGPCLKYVKRLQNGDKTLCQNGGVQIKDWFGRKCMCQFSDHFGQFCQHHCLLDANLTSKLPSHCLRVTTKHDNDSVDNEFCLNGGFPLHTKKGRTCHCHGTGFFGKTCHKKCPQTPSPSCENKMFPVECIPV